MENKIEKNFSAKIDGILFHDRKIFDSTAFFLENIEEKFGKCYSDEFIRDLVNSIERVSTKYEDFSFDTFENENMLNIRKAEKFENIYFSYYGNHWKMEDLNEKLKLNTYFLEQPGKRFETEIYSDFSATIGDVHFNDKSIFDASLFLISKIEEKFGNFNNSDFVRDLRNTLNEVYLKYEDFSFHTFENENMKNIENAEKLSDFQLSYNSEIWKMDYINEKLEKSMYDQAISIEDIDKEANKYGLKVFENGIESVYELRYIASNNTAAKSETLEELKNSFDSLKERMDFEKNEYEKQPFVNKINSNKNKGLGR